MPNELKAASDAALHDAASFFGDNHNWVRFQLPSVQDYIAYLESVAPVGVVAEPTAVDQGEPTDTTQFADLVDGEGQPVDVPQGDIEADLKAPATVDKGKGKGK